eukprot:6451826-Alexandrium_andersonii.AAC.1
MSMPACVTTKRLSGSCSLWARAPSACASGVWGWDGEWVNGWLGVNPEVGHRSGERSGCHRTPSPFARARRGGRHA